MLVYTVQYTYIRKPEANDTKLKNLLLTKDIDAQHVLSHA
jgi:hypothetical protein